MLTFFLKSSSAYLMGIIERKQKLRAETRHNILDSALHIAKKEGWHALSMRKIADSIEYTTPVIYEYFSNKDGLLEELTRIGFIRLSGVMKQARDHALAPPEKLEAMWLAYGQFAFRERELYQLMFGIDTVCFADRGDCPGGYPIMELVGPVIAETYLKKRVDQGLIKAKFYAYWATIHGLIALSFIGRITHPVPEESLMLAAIRAVSAAETRKDRDAGQSSH